MIEKHLPFMLANKVDITAGTPIYRIGRKRKQVKFISFRKEKKSYLDIGI